MKMLRRGLLGLVLCCGLASGAWAQGAIQQSGPVTQGHLGMWVGNGRMLDAGGPMTVGGAPQNNTLAGTRPSGIGLVNSGQSLALWSAYASSAYSEFLAGYDGAGNMLFTLHSVGGGNPPGCNWSINGSIYPCATVGGGNVVGPNSTVVNDVACWNNTAGGLLRDCGNAFVQNGGTTVVGHVPVWNNTTGTLLTDPAGSTATLLTNRSGNYSATAGYGGGTTGAGIIQVLGSSGTPDSTQDAVGIFQKWSNSSTNYQAVNPTLYASLHMVNGSATSRGVAAFFETRQEVSRVGDGNFIEGSRSQGIIAAGVAGTNVYGGIFVAAEEAGATHLHDMIGVESEIINQTANAPYTPVNLDVLESAYLATSFFGTKQPLAAFMVNPFTPAVASWQIGFYVPPSALDDIGAPVVGAAFRSDAKSVWGLDLLGRISTGGLGGPPTFGAIGIANNSPIRASNNAKTQTPSILSLHTDDVLHVGEDTALAGVTIGGGTAAILQMGSSAMFAANGAVATVLGGVGPVGSHTTVQKWLAIKDPAGATLYIPGF